MWYSPSIQAQPAAKEVLTVQNCRAFRGPEGPHREKGATMLRRALPFLPVAVHGVVPLIREGVE